MRRFVIVSLAALALSGCAGQQYTEEASAQCQAVGITEKDPQYATCAKAMTLIKREDALRTAYKKMLPAVPYDRMTPHADINIY